MSVEPGTKDDKYLAMCIVGAEIFRTCSKRNVYAIVLSADGRVVGTGYNGAPSGVVHCVDGGCPRARAESPDPGFRDCIAIHAEENALLYSDPAARRGGTLYVNATPCFGCAKVLAGSGLARVVYRWHEDIEAASRELIVNAGVDLVEAKDT